ncbi:hypothetical protein HMPREF1608_04551 [Escherichia coli 908525]|uniref:Uncharacterized protein n=1 Tax=Escherichia coli MS 85-1 TaxID=679202 RepID=A0AAN3SFS1_ECOLX|nr:hypothetical protein SS17_0479 [Escherichia coli O157:H7 str. SS17]EFI88233.1 hypothetical protein HMPREF9551_02764 [Escherichia coli MS 196-1]EFJ65055.1 hypothetical protein HMPREF9547_03724 [Escherichia coli MS 175-1]EFJ71858.1 hypothetical protein HMPREF9552_04548 [Escherichia coli MS 198-1]EFJ80989.1 hypothetical protein HMPREF9534_02984 [Escherichia coli MS 69-1]EFJ88129.1 hypothetical protein HMPREF9536_01431 [Escherichia coli MS 84-1]EFJ97942.1 hypothetical protein HMPREF9540_01977 
MHLVTSKNHSARSTLTPQAQVVGFAEPGCSYNQSHSLLPESSRKHSNRTRHYSGITFMSRERLLRAVAYFFTIPGQFSSECWAKSAKSRQNKTARRPFFIKSLATYWKSADSCKCVFTRCFLLHDREERQRRCPATLPTP